MAPLAINPRTGVIVTVKYEEQPVLVTPGPSGGQAAGKGTIYQPITLLPRDSDPGKGTRREFVYAAASWTFTDSWATDITAAGATLGAPSNWWPIPASATTTRRP